MNEFVSWCIHALISLHPPCWAYVQLDMSLKVVVSVFEGLARLSRRVWRRFVRGSREISLVPSLHRASTDALIPAARILSDCRTRNYQILTVRATPS